MQPEFRPVERLGLALEQHVVANADIAVDLSDGLAAQFLVERLALSLLYAAAQVGQFILEPLDADLEVFFNVRSSVLRQNRRGRAQQHQQQQ